MMNLINSTKILFLFSIFVFFSYHHISQARAAAIPDGVSNGPFPLHFDNQQYTQSLNSGQANTLCSNFGRSGSIAGGDNYLAVWMDRLDGSHKEIIGAVMNPAYNVGQTGNIVRPKFRVNHQSASYREKPSCTALFDGSYITVVRERASYGVSYNIHDSVGQKIPGMTGDKVLDTQTNNPHVIPLNPILGTARFLITHTDSFGNDWKWKIMDLDNNTTAPTHSGTFGCKHKKIGLPDFSGEYIYFIGRRVSGYCSQTFHHFHLIKKRDPMFGPDDSCTFPKVEYSSDAETGLALQIMDGNGGTTGILTYRRSGQCLYKMFDVADCTWGGVKQVGKALSNFDYRGQSQRIVKFRSPYSTAVAIAFEATGAGCPSGSPNCIAIRVVSHQGITHEIQAVSTVNNQTGDDLLELYGLDQVGWVTPGVSAVVAIQYIARPIGGGLEPRSHTVTTLVHLPRCFDRENLQCNGRQTAPWKTYLELNGDTSLCTCTCSTGYAGNNCQICATNYENYPTCSEIPCTPAANCNGNAASVTGTLVTGCTCNCLFNFQGPTCGACAPGYENYPTCSLAPCPVGFTNAPSCDTCATNYENYPTCSAIPCTNAANCNGGATSVSGTLATGCTCTCGIAFTGASCQTCAANYENHPTCSPIPCTTAANCNGNAASVTGTRVSGCTCSCSTGFTGSSCDTCATNYENYPSCSEIPCTNAANCNGGATSVSGTLVTGCTCTCGVAFVGASCQTCAANYENHPTCSPISCLIPLDCSNLASSVTGTLVSGCSCNCITGFGGSSCDTCATNYENYPTCSEILCTNAANCNGNAASVTGTLVTGCSCTCLATHRGPACEFTTTSTMSHSGSTTPSISPTSSMTDTSTTSTSASVSTTESATTSFSTSISIEEELGEYRTSTLASIPNPLQLAFDDHSNTLYVAQGKLHTISAVDITGAVECVAGLLDVSGATDNVAGPSARFSNPSGIVFEVKRQWLFVADTDNHVIRVILTPSSSPFVSLSAGQFGVQSTVDHAAGLSSTLDSPQDLAIAPDSSFLFWTQSTSFVIRKQALPYGGVSTVAGSVGSQGTIDGASALFYDPRGLAVDDLGDLLLVEGRSSTLRKVSPDGTVTTIIGATKAVHDKGYIDGKFSTAMLHNSLGVCVDGGAVFLADTHNLMIRHVDFTAGTISRLAGLGQPHNTTLNGPSKKSSFGLTRSCIVSKKSHAIFVSDVSNNNIRVIRTATATESKSIIPPEFQADMIRVVSNKSVSTSIYTSHNTSVILTQPNSLVRIDFMGNSFNLSDVENHHMLAAQDGFIVKALYVLSPTARAPEKYFCFDGFPCHIELPITYSGRYEVEFHFTFLQGFSAPFRKVTINAELPGDKPTFLVPLTALESPLISGSVLSFSAKLVGSQLGTLVTPHYERSPVILNMTCGTHQTMVYTKLHFNTAQFENVVTPDSAQCTSGKVRFQAQIENTHFKTQILDFELCPAVSKLHIEGSDGVQIETLPDTASLKISPPAVSPMSYSVMTPYVRPSFLSSLPQCRLGDLQTVPSVYLGQCQIRCPFQLLPSQVPFKNIPVSLEYAAAQSILGRKVEIFINNVTSTTGIPSKIVVQNEGATEFLLNHLHQVSIPHCFTAQLFDAAGTRIPPLAHEEQLTISAFGTQKHFHWTKHNRTKEFRVCNISFDLHPSFVNGTTFPIHFRVGAVTTRLMINVSIPVLCGANKMPTLEMQITGGCPYENQRFQCAHFGTTLQIETEIPPDNSSIVALTFGGIACGNVTIISETALKRQLAVSNCTHLLTLDSRLPWTQRSSRKHANDFMIQSAEVFYTNWKVTTHSVSLTWKNPFAVGIWSIQNFFGCYKNRGGTFTDFGYPSVFMCEPASAVFVIGWGFSPDHKFCFQHENFPEHCSATIYQSSPLISGFQISVLEFTLSENALGPQGRVVLRNESTNEILWSQSSDKPSISFTPKLRDSCERNPVTNELCSGRRYGLCDVENGRCVCVRHNILGHYGGHACEKCHINYNASTGCTKKCPSLSKTGICNGQGTCKEGKCTCSDGYFGTTCEQFCPGSPPCSKHGTCSRRRRRCLCYSDNRGHWKGADCSMCQTGWSGPMCRLQCPRDNKNRICSGIGVCFNGKCACPFEHCGLACEIHDPDKCSTDCPFPGQWGASCQYRCPSQYTNPEYAARYPCNSRRRRGQCNAGRTGDGKCTCARGWAGPACMEICPGGSWYPCNGHGECNQVHNFCVCEPTWATEACGIQCPIDANGEVCSGHGRCNDGATESGNCECNLGYAGEDCSQICPGGADTPCTGHGLCNKDNTCTCMASSAGHWAGNKCNRCAKNYYGPNCNGQCQLGKNGEQCNGRGRCRADLRCECFHSETDGYWTGETCDECVYGAWGPDCNQECPGGLCAACTSPQNGVCTAEGTCICKSSETGSWTGKDCSKCFPGYYGFNCEKKCPGFQTIAINSGRNETVVCGGHGECESSFLSDGTCTCTHPFALDAHGTCTACEEHFYGPTCQPCGFTPPEPAIPCHGHGTCDANKGTCACDLGYSGDRCNLCQYNWMDPLELSSRRNITHSPSSTLAAVPDGVSYGPLPLFVYNDKPYLYSTFNPTSSDLVCSNYGHVTSNPSYFMTWTDYRSGARREIRGVIVNPAVNLDDANSIIKPPFLVSSKSSWKYRPACTALHDGSYVAVFNAVRWGKDSSGKSVVFNLHNAEGDKVQTDTLVNIDHTAGDQLSPKVWLLNKEYGARRFMMTYDDFGVSPFQARWSIFDLDVSTVTPQHSGILVTSQCRSTSGRGDFHGKFIYSVAEVSGSGCKERSGLKIYKNPDPAVANITTEKECTLKHGSYSAGYFSVTIESTGVIGALLFSRNGQVFIRQFFTETCHFAGSPFRLVGTSGFTESGTIPRLVAFRSPFSGFAVALQVSGPGCPSRCLALRVISAQGLLHEMKLVPTVDWETQQPLLGGLDQVGSTKLGIDGVFAIQYFINVNERRRSFSVTTQLHLPRCFDREDLFSCTQADDAHLKWWPTYLDVGGNTTLCTCDTRPLLNCSDCAPDFYGPACTRRCDACDKTTSYCNDGRGGDGKCVCHLGYSGETCQLRCPGALDNPCSGHGVCDTLLGVCHCYQNDVHGHWAGDVCSTCDINYNSTDCRIACPTDEGKICSNRGWCFDGVCNDCAYNPRQGDDETAICGTSCQLQGTQCPGIFEEPCPRGFSGIKCDTLCPGATAENPAETSCSGKGTCTKKEGFCQCQKGAYGPDCSVICPRLSPTAPNCAGHGSCAASGTCVCTRGYYGTVCELECPGGGETPCNNHGTCVNGTCVECDFGYGGLACENHCLIDNRGGFCGRGGVCNPETLQCDCFSNFTHGFFKLEDSFCSICSGPYAGVECLRVCNPEGVRSKFRSKCLCKIGWGGEFCDTECPMHDGLYCSGNGVCRSHDGTCQCNPSYFTSNCSVKCNEKVCSEEHGLVYSQCSTEKGREGTCECLYSTKGAWAGASCDECAEGFWGLYCATPCNCNGNGGCDRYTGTCNCFDDDERGHWAGQYCTYCKKTSVGDTPAYVGVSCRSRNIQISSNAARAVSVLLHEGNYSAEEASLFSASFLLHDSAQGVVYTGSDPILIFRTPRTLNESYKYVSKFRIPTGAPLTATILPDVIQFQTLSNGVLPLQLWELPRYAFFQNNNVGGYLRLLSAASTSSRKFAAQAQTSSVKFAVSSPTDPHVALAVHLDGSVSIMNSKSSVIKYLDTSTARELLQLDSVKDVTAFETSFVVAGEHEEEWAVTLIGVSSDVATINTRFAYFNQSISPVVGGLCGNGCPYALTCLYDPRSIVLPRFVCAVQSIGGMILVALREGSPTTIAEQLTVHDGLGVREFSVSAKAIDVNYGANLGILAMREDVNVPSSLYKFNLDTLVQTGIEALVKSGEILEVATGLHVNSTTRELLVVVVKGPRLEYRSMNLFGVKSVYPTVIDSFGGATITVNGEGFLPFAEPSCVFAGESGLVLNRATFVDSSTLICNTPQAATRSLCDASMINIQFGDRSTNVSSVPLHRPLTVQLHTAQTVVTENSGYISMYDSDEIVITGAGFKSERDMTPACDIVSADDTITKLQCQN